MNRRYSYRTDGRGIAEKLKSLPFIIGIAVGLIVIIFIIVNIANGVSKGRSGETLEDEEVQAELPVQKTYNMPPADQENDLLKIATSVFETDKKICYLTFDDGPTKEVTPKVLEILDQYGVKATFFTLGKLLEANPDIAKQVHDKGHLLANHSYYHIYDDLYASADSFMSEINKTTEKIKEITGEEPFRLMRFPGGGHNAGKYGAQKQEYKQVLKENGYYFADWNCLNGDAEAQLRSTGELLERVKETAVGKNIVVLMHDAAAKKTTPDALGSIIEYLKSKGYEFKRLDEVEYYDTTEQADENSMIL